MPYIKVNPRRLLQLQSELQSVPRTIESVKNTVQSVRTSLDWDVKSEEQIDRTLREVSQSLNEGYNRFNKTVKLLETAAQKYDRAENDGVDTLTATISSPLIDNIRNVLGPGSTFADIMKLPINQMTGDIWKIVGPHSNITDLLNFQIDQLSKNNVNSIGPFETLAEMLDFHFNDISDEGIYSLLSVNAGKTASLGLFNAMERESEEQKNFAASLARFGIGTATLSLVGGESTQQTAKFFAERVAANIYGAKYQDEDDSLYFGKVSYTSENDLEGKYTFEDYKKQDEAGRINQELEKKGLRQSETDQSYYEYDDGELRELKDYDDKLFYDEKATIAEANIIGGQVSAAIFDGTHTYDGGKISAVIGEAEAHASLVGGLYVMGASGEKKFAPGIKADIGGSVTALEVEWDQQWMGDEMLGLNSNVTATAGKASAGVSGTVQFFGDDGPQVGVSASAEAIAGELEGDIGLNVLGGEIGVAGGVNFGIGAHADVGYRDGVFKFDIGASLGVGVSLDVEVDIGGMVDTVVDAAEAAWDGIKEGWNDFWNW